LLLPLADTRAGGRRPDMGACSDASVINPAACAHRPDMRPGFHAAITDPCAGADDRTGMTARGNAVASDTGTRADTADMGAGANAMTADMGVRTDAQHIHAQINGVGGHGRQGNECEKRRGEYFHRMSSLWDGGKQTFCLRRQQQVLTRLGVFLDALLVFPGALLEGNDVSPAIQFNAGRSLRRDRHFGVLRWRGGRGGFVILVRHGCAVRKASNSERNRARDVPAQAAAI
jgi:hypothetical protein